MHNQAGTIWEHVPTELDRLWYPSICLMNECEFLVRGSEQGLSREQVYVLKSWTIEALSMYDEGLYWTLAEEKTRPWGALSRIQTSALLESISRAWRGPDDGGRWHHYLLCGAENCYEFIASDYFEITEFASEEAARSRIAGEPVQ